MRFSARTAVVLCVAALYLAAAGGLRAADTLQTPAEASDFERTPNYEETLEFIRSLSREWPAIQLDFYGTSAQGRPMPVVTVSADGTLTPLGSAASGKALVMIQNGIHAGEIDGKDATLMILRDMAAGEHRELLSHLNLLIVPIYNVDGHERVSPYNRPNQDGPVAGMGFRTTADGHDLNRDHLKLETPEARAMIALFNRWRPHLHVDNHVTNGVDHDWVLTYSWVEAPQAPPPIDAWLALHMPEVVKATKAAGHRTGPYVSLIDRADPAKGINSYIGAPHFATGYYPLRNVPSILVENHAHKPYRARVLANRDFMLALLSETARDPGALIDAVTAAAQRTVALGRPDAAPSDVGVQYRSSDNGDMVRFPVYDWYTETSVVSGRPLLLYRRGQVRGIDAPWWHRPHLQVAVSRPRGYLVEPGWPGIEALLAQHDLRVRRLSEPVALDAETIRIANPRETRRNNPTYQGRTLIDVDVTRQNERVELPAGALWVGADQPDFEVAVQLFEPEAPDSLVRWGMLSIVLERKEYIGGRTLEGLARGMLEDPEIAAAWKAALEDGELASDPSARYLWWYKRTRHWDSRVGRLPVMRVLSAPPF